MNRRFCKPAVTWIMEGHIQLLTSNKGKPSIGYNGYHYRFCCKAKSGNKTWRCARTSSKCKATLISDANCHVMISTKNEHNHDPDEHKLETQRFRTSVKRKAEDDLCSNPRKLVCTTLTSEAENSLLPKDLKNFSKAAYRVRRKAYPKLPRNREEVHTALQEKHIETNKSESFVLLNSREEGIIIFSTTTNLRCLSNCREVFMDGTFKSCAKFFYQLYTIHGFKNGNYIPLVFALLPGKSREVYQILFTSLLQLCIGNLFQFQPEIIHVDFESPVLQCLQQFFPTSLIKCCKFHLGQAMWRKVQSLGLAREYKENTDIGKWIHACYGLPFFAPHRRRRCFCGMFNA